MAGRGEGVDALAGLHPRFRALDGLRFWPALRLGQGSPGWYFRENPCPWTFRVGRYVRADGLPAVFVLDAHGQKVANLTVNLEGEPGVPALPPEAVCVRVHESPLAEVLRGFPAFDVWPRTVRAGRVEEYAQVWRLSARLDIPAFREACEARVQEELRRIAVKDAAERLGHRPGRKS